ncbi:BTAD domain-containing putative transcriptional regulator [Mycobacterium sp. URHB0044]|uniref:BTAD domain-containing putative transcriptional regulator n=1 Tax=Mycobacterium sp. URHB0044 TaxID=1380386 RepID=UPI001E4A4323|nr:BTAD domain-containing putative transcriptional regulator [Mycobacterium sp. URHB0044]
MRVAVFGPVRAWVHGGPVDLGGRRQRSLLARLVSAQGRVVSVDRLIDDLWEGEPPPKALAALQAYISHLRRVLEPNRQRRAPATVIVSASPGYRLQLSADAVDVWEFEAKIRAAEDDTDPSRRAAMLDEALVVWSDEPFAEVADTSWATPEIARLGELRLAAVETGARAHSSLGADARVIAVLGQHVRDHPGREGAACLLATAQYRTGHQAAALDTLRRTRDYLDAELGLEPGREMRVLEQDILAHAVHLHPVAVPQAGPAVPPKVPKGAIHGRDDELADVAKAGQEAINGGCRVLWIGGEAGAGKTTLAESATEGLRAAGWVVARGHCPEVDGAPPAWAWTEVVRQFADGFAPIDPRHANALEQLLHHDGEHRDSGSFWMARAVADILGRAAVQGPVAVLLEDLHRTDGLTLELLRLAADALVGRPVLVIATYRPSEAGSELESARAALAARTAAHLILSGLDAAATVALAADSGLTDVSGQTLRLLRERTGGNPLFVRELARLMAAEGADAVQSAVPAGIRDVLRRRLARLPGATLTALRQAAVLGRDVDVDLLAELAGRDTDDLLDALEPAVVVGLLVEPGPGLVRFAHAVVRDTLYEDISLLRRSRLHAAALAILRQRARAADPTSLAHHAAAAATPDTAAEAAEFAVAAAREADAVGAHAEAARQWRSAVQLLELTATRAKSAPDHLDRDMEARCGLIGSLARAGDVVAARSELKRALACASLAAGEVGDALAARALVAWDAPLLWRVRIADTVDGDIVDPLHRALEAEARSAHPAPVRARLLLTLFAEVEGADTPASLAASSEALELARDAHAADPGAGGRLLCAALNARAYCALGPDIAAQRDALAGEFLAVAEAAGEVDYQAIAHWMSFLAASGRSDLAAAQRHVDLAVARAGTGQLSHLLTVLEVFAAQLTVLAGHPDEGERRYATAAARLFEQGAANGALMALVGRITAGFARGDLGPLADELLVVHDTVSTTIADVAVLALLAAGRTDEARRLWRTRQPVERSYYWLAMMTFRAHAAAALGDMDAAKDCLAQLLPYSGRMAGLDNGSLLAGPVDDALAAVAELDGRVGEADRYRADATALRSRLAADAARLIP